MHFKIPQGHFIQQKEIGKAHLHFVFFSHLSHHWKWWLGYYLCDILNTLYLVSEIFLRDFLYR